MSICQMLISRDDSSSAAILSFPRSSPHANVSFMAMARLFYAWNQRFAPAQIAQWTSSYTGSHRKCYRTAMAKLIQVRELKNQTTQLLRIVESGATLIVTRRGKPVATLRRFQAADLSIKPQYDTANWDHLSASIEARHPELRNEIPDRKRREFDRLTSKSNRKLPFKTWQEADRWAKGRRKSKD